jgi:hypothetical protein
MVQRPFLEVLPVLPQRHQPRGRPHDEQRGGADWSPIRTLADARGMRPRVLSPGTRGAATALPVQGGGLTLRRARPPR